MTLPPSIVHHVLLFYGLHITNRRSGIGQGTAGRAGRADGRFRNCYMYCQVGRRCWSGGRRPWLPPPEAEREGGAKCVSYGGYIEEVIPAVRDILANCLRPRRHRRTVLYPLFVAMAVESVERPAGRLQLGSIAASLSYMNPPFHGKAYKAR